ncbi:glycosyltransferase family 32 protein [Peribacillus sp. SCS-37]|uniref:glycosyltransferase family 32 protein n=1 Tax=Paraperibacillus esterisolvens TaxID=3115296 RepID=UPI003905EE18
MRALDKIPKIIHYCWFGNKEKPPIVKRCIQTWKQVLPHYEIVEWNETSLDLRSNQYVIEAYNSGKFAFVSDYVRVYALYHFGGIYLDTDVEVFQSFDDLLFHNSFWGFEQENFIATSTIGAEKGNKVIEMFLESYEKRSFILDGGAQDTLTNVAVVTSLLKSLGIRMDGTKQVLPGLGAFYPQTFFSPYDYINCRKFITDDTYAMHHFYKSWLSPKAKLKSAGKTYLAKIIGGNNIYRLRQAISRVQVKS